MAAPAQPTRVIPAAEAPDLHQGTQHLAAPQVAQAAPRQAAAQQQIRHGAAGNQAAPGPEHTPQLGQSAQVTPRPQHAAPAAPQPQHAPQPEAAQVPLDATAAILRRYTPLGTSGKGAFGKVEKCLDTRLKRLVAIKRIPLTADEGSVHPADVETALDEARSACRLSNSHIVTVHDFHHDRRFAYIIMEYVDGLNLAEFLAQVEGRSLTYDETAAVAEALCSAVQTAHEGKALHLDIKPANILIDRKGNVKLTDFGTAVLASAAGWADARGGTIGYMPPEQLTDGLVDYRADLFALAAVLYECLCGTAPFLAATPQASLRKIKRGPTPPSELLPGIPAPVEQALLRALSASADDRQPSVAAFADEILPELGDPAAGRRSLARMMAQITEGEEGEQDPAEPAEPRWEYDPELGYLGARWRPAERVALGLAAAVGTGASISGLLPAAGLTAPGLSLLVSLAVAAAAGAAPQIGSALVFAGLVVALVSAAPLATVLTAGVLAFVMLASWWLAWGRVSPAASAVALALAGAGLATGSPLAGASAGAMAAAYWLSPGAAAGTCAVGLVFGRLLSTGAAVGFNLPPEGLAQAFADPRLLAAGAGYCLLAAAASAGLRGAARARRSTAHVLLGLVCAGVGIVVVLLQALANPVEIAAGPGAAFAVAASPAALSSIIGGILICAFGESLSSTEGERP